MDRTVACAARSFVTLSIAAILLLASGAVAHAGPRSEAAAAGAVVINELAPSSSRSDADSFFELRNLSDHEIDLSDWHVYRCSMTGLRAKRGQVETALSGVVLRPGEIFTAGRVGTMTSDGRPPDAMFSNPYSETGFGLYLEDPTGALVDAVAVYPSEPTPMPTECSAHGNLPSSLAAALDESWQRVSATGDVRADFVRAVATPGAANVARPAAIAAPGVRIGEVAPAGPAGSADDFVEIVGAAAGAIDVGGWRLYPCTASGRLSADTPQVTIAPGTTLGAGQRYLLGGPGYSPRTGEGRADAASAVSLADVVSGVLLTTAAGVRVDGVTISNHLDTACQTGDDKLASMLDYRSGQSWQRHPDSGRFAIAPRTPGLDNDVVATMPAASAVARPAGVAISEFAVDPAIEPTPPGYERHHFIELGNYGTSRADIGGLALIACGVNGFRETGTLATVADGTWLAPGEVWVAALRGTPAAAHADALFDDPLDFLGAGAWIEDAAGGRIDSVGAYHANEMDFSLERYSPCSNGLSLPTFVPDRLEGETYQRSRFTGVDVDDFVTAVATPGEMDERAWRDPAVLTAAAASRLSARVEALAAHSAPVPASVDVRTGGRAADVSEAWAGVSDAGPLHARVGTGERRLDATAGPAAWLAADDGYGLPYVRLSMAMSDVEPRITWHGRALERGVLRLSVWDPAAAGWRRLDERGGPTADGSLVLTGVVRPGERPAGTAKILVQSVPRAGALHGSADGAFADPAAYDLAISHLTDTQYLTEAYPQVYAEAVGWIIANRDVRKIAFATHTGDLVQNWVDPDQTEPRARREFEIASEIQALLDGAEVPNSVLPGNHDNKRGITNELFNEYFGPDRYEGAPWYGGSIAPGDNSANFSTFERAGSRFLMLSLPYAFGERELAWAEDVVAQHPDHNVVVSTHEHVTPAALDSPVGRSVGSRWVSRGGELWERVVAPNRNVVAVLSGHFHGLGRIVTENAGGIDGHTVVEMVADYQEFRTHSGERSTGFQRLLQIDLAAGVIAVDTFSSNLGAHASYPYDYEQFVPENGHETTGTNARPWRILEAGLQDRYTAADDDFVLPIAFQYEKAVHTAGVYVSGE